MKKLFFILIAISLIHQFAISQWVQQVSGVSSSLLDIDFINENTGWACGDGGIIVKTTNGGINWIQQNSGVNKRLEGIDAVDANILYCVGWFQTILKSTNGGTDWIIIRDGQVTPPDPSFFKTFFLNQNTGWMVRGGSSGGYILRTTNGGLAFDSTNVIFSFLRDIYFKNASTGILCGNGALIMRSSDGGVTWNQVSLPLSGGLPNLYRISFVGDYGWTIGEGDNTGLGKLVFRTTNFGSTWDTISRIQYPNANLNYCVFFSSLNTGYAGGTNGFLYKSTNGGLNWFQQVITGGGFRRDFSLINDTLGWVVGGGGHIFKTTNGGTYVGIEPISNSIPGKFQLYQNYPNPFNPVTNFEFRIAGFGLVTLRIFNLLGEEIAVLVNEELNHGTYKIQWVASEYSSGVYFYSLETNLFRDTKKMILIK